MGLVGVDADGGSVVVGSGGVDDGVVDGGGVFGAGTAVDSGAVYFTVPMGCSPGRNSVTGTQTKTLTLASTIFPTTL